MDSGSSSENRGVDPASKHRGVSDREHWVRVYILSMFECTTSEVPIEDSEKLIGLRHNGLYHYPNFQFDDPDLVEAVNTLVGVDVDPWGVAEWWMTPSVVLDERCPLEALRDHVLDSHMVALIVKYELS